MFGDYNSDNFSNLIVTYEVCSYDDKSVKCKSEQEITEATKFSYLIVLENA